MISNNFEIVSNPYHSEGSQLLRRDISNENNIEKQQIAFFVGDFSSLTGSMSVTMTSRISANAQANKLVYLLLEVQVDTRHFQMHFLPNMVPGTVFLKVHGGAFVHIMDYLEIRPVFQQAVP